MRQRRPSNYELQLDRLQRDEAPDGEERHGILELFERDEQPEHDPDEDAPLQRDDGE